VKAWIERFRAWWTALADRERRMLSFGGGALALMLFYLVVWEPVVAARADREQALAASRALAARLELIGAEVQRSRGSGGAAAITSRNQSLLSVVDQSTKSATLGKAPSRLTPEGDTIVKLWIEDVSFDAVVRWLHDLQTRHGVNVEDADIERRSGAGLVSVRLTLVRP